MRFDPGAPRVQLPLPLEPGRKPRWSNFIDTPARVAAVLQGWLQDADADLCGLVGPQNAGKTHLLLAAAADWQEAGGRARYVPLGQAGQLPSPSELSNGLLLVDDLPQLPADQALSLVRAIDAAREGRWRIVFASRVAMDALELPFEDLRSRLTWGARLTVAPLDETGLGHLLAQRAAELGAHWPQRNTDYLLRRLPRQPGALLAAFEAAWHRATSEGRQLGRALLAEVLQAPQFATAIQQTGGEPQAAAEEQRARP